MNIRFETKAAGGRKSKACEKMETKNENKRPKEAQTSTLNQSKKDVLGGDGQNAWLNIYICGWFEVEKRRRMVRINKSD